MRKLMLVLVIVIVLASLARASDDEYVIGKIKWGMDGVAVQETEGKPLKATKIKPDDKGEVLIYEKNIFDTKCHIGYHFADHQLDLNQITYVFYPENKLSATRIHMDIDGVLRKKYRKVTDSDPIAPITIYEDDHTKVTLLHTPQQVGLTYETQTLVKKLTEEREKKRQEDEKKRKSDLSRF
ncbi:MAG: hypothetical protein FWH34_00235 [Desulfovibrionaceae bacterium]|nr:hypothetical protein [Desulfovibrionaceae bacterium]